MQATPANASPDVITPAVAESTSVAVPQVNGSVSAVVQGKKRAREVDSLVSTSALAQVRSADLLESYCRHPRLLLFPLVLSPQRLPLRLPLRPSQRQRLRTRMHSLTSTSSSTPDTRSGRNTLRLIRSTNYQGSLPRLLRRQLLPPTKATPQSARTGRLQGRLIRRSAQRVPHEQAGGRARNRPLRQRRPRC